MQAVYFQSRCDVELGDKVGFASTTTEIIDIRAVHYIKDQRVEFEFSLAIAPWRWYKRQDFIYPVVGQTPTDTSTELILPKTTFEGCANCGNEVPASLREGETHPVGALSPGETVIVHLDGTVCEKCGCQIVRRVSSQSEQPNQERWDKAIAHARECFEIYREVPAGIFAATMIASDIAKYDRGDRNPELLEDLEGIKL